jgi:predicted carbohydrate-binding protein with CBM5 and CBM33 domain
VQRRLALLVAGGALLGAVAFGAPAQAHGALSTPTSRSVVCGAGTQAQMNSSACKAAVAAGADVADWDNIRVPGVDGRDRQVIPDGQLCSGGLAKFAGLDLPRTDWPTTKVRSGASFTFAYKERIPHKGSFRIYVTKNGFDPKKPLRWADLETKPFLTATDPSISDGAYVMKGKLPAKTGRQIIYTIWQTTSTPDTYYSCSDVVFTAAPAASTSTAPSPATAAAPLVPSEKAQPSLVPQAAQTVVRPLSRSGVMWGMAGAGGLAVLIAGGVIVATRKRPLPKHR